MNTSASASSNKTRGRPSSFTPERVGKLLAAVRKGVPYVHAAAAAGISFDTFNRWRLKGESGQNEKYREFCDQLAAAEAEAASVLVSRVVNASRKDWRAAVWMLQRRFPKEWGTERKENNPSAISIGFEQVGF